MGTRMYVVSPGVGLRPLDWLAPAYAATFTTGPDSPLAIARRRDWPRRRAPSDWWRALTGGGGWPGVLDSLDGGDQILAVLPVNAWRAVGESLAEAVSVRRELLPRLWLLCVGRVQLPELLTTRLLPTQGVDWVSVFGCPRGTVALTLTRWLLETPLKDWTWGGVTRRLETIAGSQSDAGNSTTTAPCT